MRIYHMVFVHYIWPYLLPSNFLFLWECCKLQVSPPAWANFSNKCWSFSEYLLQCRKWGFQIFDELDSGKPSLRLLYVTPELIDTGGFAGKLKKLHGRGLLTLIAIDEVTVQLLNLYFYKTSWNLGNTILSLQQDAWWCQDFIMVEVTYEDETLKGREAAFIASFWRFDPDHFVYCENHHFFEFPSWLDS